MKKIILLIVLTLLAVICYAQSPGAKLIVLEKNEGKARVRRPRGVLPTPTAEFILKVTPENSKPPVNWEERATDPEVATFTGKMCCEKRIRSPSQRFLSDQPFRPTTLAPEPGT
jgi:hypothetical protein